jgi:hypothetical protein
MNITEIHRPHEQLLYAPAGKAALFQREEGLFSNSTRENLTFLIDNVKISSMAR